MLPTMWLGKKQEPKTPQQKEALDKSHKVADEMQNKIESTWGKVHRQGYASGTFKKKVHKTMHEFKEGELKSGSKHGPVVTDRAQAVAISLAQARKAKGLAFKKKG
jgi:hypothetical protein